MRLLIALLLLLVSADSWADSKPQGPILLWGFQRGCTPLTSATHDVQQHLELTVAKPADALLPDRKLLSCQGSGCGALVQRACPNAKGRIMGGFVEQNSAHTLTRLRLWLYDPLTGQTAYHDNYCQSCDMTKALKANAAEIAQFGTVMSPPGSAPLYCQQDPPQAELPSHSNKVYWVVYGKEHHKPAITAAVRKLVQQIGTEVPFEHEGKEYTTSVLKKVIAKEPGAQVFGAEIQSNGVVEVFLYDGPTDLIEIQRAECDGCDKDDLIEKVKQTTLNVLSHCFGESCARVGRARAPAEACRPFEMPRCGDGDVPIPLTPSSSDPRASAGSSAPLIMSPAMARITKGAVWGVFAASAAATVGLLAANFTGAGRVEAGNATVSNILVPGIGASAGVTIVSLGVAIPITILADRSMAAPSSGPTEAKRTSEPSSSALLIQCPN